MLAPPALPLNGNDLIAYRLVVVCDMDIATAGLDVLLQKQQEFPCLAQLTKSEDALDVISGVRPHLVMVYTRKSPAACVNLCRRTRAKYPGTSLLVICDETARYCPAAGVSWDLPDWTSDDQLVKYIHQIVATDSVGAVSEGPARGSAIRSVECPVAPTGAAKPRLTAKQQSVLRLLLQGQPNAKIAETLSISVAAVKWHLQAIYTVLGVHGRTEAVAHLLRQDPNAVLQR